MKNFLIASLIPLVASCALDETSSQELSADSTSAVTGDADLLSGFRCAQYRRTLEGMFDGATAGNIDAFLGGFADDATFEVNTATLPWSGRWVGKDGILAMFGVITQHAVPTTYDITTFTCDAAKRRVVIQGVEGIQHVANGTSMTFDNIEVWQFNPRGKVTSTRIYFDTAVVADFIR